MKCQLLRLVRLAAPDRVRLGPLEWDIRRRVERLYSKWCESDLGQNLVDELMRKCDRYKDDLRGYTACVVEALSERQT